MNQVTIAGASLGYGRKVILRAVGLGIQRGDFWAIVGPNGSGKTTLLRGILGTLAPLQGRIARAAGLQIGYVPQREALDPIFPLTAREIVMMGRYALIGLGRRPGAADSSAVGAALAQVGIAELADRQFREFSGGQKQRCLIARALAGAPELLVLDEPTTGMDLRSQEAVLALLARLHAEQGMSIVMVSHVLNEVAHYAQQVAVVEGGAVVAGPVAEVVTTERLSDLYGLEVQVAEVAGRRVVVPGRTR